MINETYLLMPLQENKNIMQRKSRLIGVVFVLLVLSPRLYRAQQTGKKACFHAVFQDEIFIGCLALKKRHTRGAQY